MMGYLRPGEEAALLKEAKALAGPQPAGAAGGRGRGKRGGGSGRDRGRGRSSGAAAAAAAAARAEATTTGRKGLESPPPRMPGGGLEEGGEGEGSEPGDAAAAGPAGAAGAAGGAGEPAGPLLEGVRFLCLEEHDVMALWEARPAFVVMYDPDVALTRQLELYKAQSGCAGGRLCCWHCI